MEKRAMNVMYLNKQQVAGSKDPKSGVNQTGKRADNDRVNPPGGLDNHDTIINKTGEVKIGPGSGSMVRRRGLRLLKIR